MEREVIANKRWIDATIRDNFVFGRTMELYPDICRRLLEIILNVEIADIRYPEREKTIEARTDGKGIRLDVFVEDVNRNRYFDVEMQIADSDNLAKRVRYYQGLIDIDKLKRGQHYSTLGESFIIFICPFDHFKQGRHIYSFHERCDQDTKLALEDGATKIFLSTKGYRDDVSVEIKAFLDYVESGIVSGKFVEDLAAAVESVKRNEKVRHDFMTLQMALLEERMQTEERVRNAERESVAVKLIHMGLNLADIQKATNLPVQRLEELAKENRNSLI